MGGLGGVSVFGRGDSIAWLNWLLFSRFCICFRQLCVRRDDDDGDDDDGDDDDGNDDDNDGRQQQH